MLFTNVISLLLVSCALTCAADIRLGVMGLFNPSRLSLQPTSAMLRLTAGDLTTVIQPGHSLSFHAIGSDIDFWLRNRQNDSRQVRVTGIDGKAAAFQLSVPGKLTRTYFGTLQVRAGSGVLIAIVDMDRELAVAATVAAEYSPGTPQEALRTLAVLARSYYHAAHGRHLGYDFCDTTHCQFHRSLPASGDPARTAAEVTRDEVVTYNGLVFAPMYSAACGGRTRSARESGVSPEPYPYISVECATCAQNELTWQRSLPRTLTEILIAAPTESNRLKIVRRLGWSALPGSNYTARIEDDALVLIGRGEGHGIGVCQRGVIGMAKAGASYRDILLHYLPKTNMLAGTRYNALP